MMILIQVMRNSIQKFRKSYIFFEKPGILSENFKTLISSNFDLLKLRTSFLLTNAWKSVLGISFFFFLDLELFAKIKKTWFLQTCFLHFY